MPEHPIQVVGVELTGTTPTTIAVPAPGRTVRLRKLLAYNPNAGDVVIEVGSYDGNTFTPILPKIVVYAGRNVVLGVNDLPQAEIVGTGTLQLAARLTASAASPVELAVELEVR